MQKLTEILVCLVLIIALRKQGHTKAQVSFQKKNPIVFIDLDFKKKSCPDGYVHNVDYFIVNGRINVTNVPNPITGGFIILTYQNFGNSWVEGTNQPLWTITCKDESEVPPNRCRCLFGDDKQIRVKCNITMHWNYMRTYFRLAYDANDYYLSDPSDYIPYVYGNTSCMKWVIESTYLGHNNAQVPIVPKKKPCIVFMDLDFKKKSCPDGYVHNVDYFIVNGRINVTNIPHPISQGFIILYYQNFGITWVDGTNQPLWTITCKDEPEVPPNRCRCLSGDDKQIRVKCNITMHWDYMGTFFRLGYRANDHYESDPSNYFMEYVYGNTSCMNWVIYSKNQGCSLVGGAAIIFTALVFTVSSLISYGQ